MIWQDKASWQAEQDIYNLPRMEHDNILKFLGVERRGENLQVSFDPELTQECINRGVFFSRTPLQLGGGK